MAVLVRACKQAKSQGGRSRAKVSEGSQTAWRLGRTFNAALSACLVASRLSSGPDKTAMLRRLFISEFFYGN